MSMSVEDGYDKVVVIDGLGRQQEHTGNKELRLEHLPTPVSVIILTDYSGSSEALELSSVTFE
jgi:hypothetical protein